jgi:two-component system, cell cycle sensor histidine kinase and response regulator CckA
MCSSETCGCTLAADDCTTSLSRLVTIRLGNDLRALLRLMSMSVESLRERWTTDAAAERDLVELDGAIHSAFQIARELITMDEPRSGQAAVTDVNELIVQLEGVLVRMLGDQIRMHLRIEAVDGMVEAETVQLEWALLNLAANSRDAMPNGGLFEIRTASVTRRSDGVPYIRVTVTDSGPGMPEDVRARAFEPFVSTQEGRPGFGLTSVALIVRRFRGWVDIESDTAGTSVHIHLPALSAAKR